MEILILLLVFVTTVMFVLGVSRSLRMDKQRLKNRLENLTRAGRWTGSGPEDGGQEDGERDKITSSRTSWTLRLLRIVAPGIARVFYRGISDKKSSINGTDADGRRSFKKRTELRLAQANIPLRVEEFLGIQAGLTFIPPFFIFVITGNIFLALILAVAGFVVPDFVVARGRTKRVRKLNDQLGDALVIMANALKAGFGFLQAMEIVSKEMPTPIGDEFARVLREMNLGVTTEDALNNLAHRIGSDDLDLVVTAMLIQRQVGGNLAEVLTTISETIRERVRIKGEIKTLTAQGRISGTIIGLLPLAITFFLLVINPTYIGTLFVKPAGLIAVGVGLCSQVIGVLMIRKITAIRV